MKIIESIEDRASQINEVGSGSTIDKIDSYCVTKSVPL